MVPDLFGRGGGNSPASGGGTMSPRGGSVTVAPKVGHYESAADLYGNIAPTVFAEDSVAPLLSRAPRVRPPPTGPREDCPNDKFRGRYSKSEIFGDSGRRHYVNAHDAKVAWQPTGEGLIEGASAASGALSPGAVVSAPQVALFRRGFLVARHHLARRPEGRRHTSEADGPLLRASRCLDTPATQ